MMPRLSIDEIISKRRMSATDDGKLFKAIIADGVESKGFDAATRSQRFIMSSESVDRYGDIVRQAGLDITDFEKNPVGLAFHDHRKPIGWWSDVTKVSGAKKRTEGTITLHPAGTTEEVDEVGALLAANAIKACSIGFMPGEAEWILDEDGRNTYGIDFATSALLECSVVTIPANPDALAKAAGGDFRLAAEVFEKVLDTYCEKTTGGLYVRKEFEYAYFQIKQPKTVSAPAIHAVKIDIDTADAEAKLDKLATSFWDRIKAMMGAGETVPMQPPADKEERYGGVITLKGGDGQPVEVVGEWPETARIAKDGDLLLGAYSRIESCVVVRCANGVAEYDIDIEDDDYLYLSISKTGEPEPTAPVIVKGTRAKAIVARERMKETLRERGLLT